MLFHISSWLLFPVELSDCIVCNNYVIHLSMIIYVLFLYTADHYRILVTGDHFLYFLKHTKVSVHPAVITDGHGHEPHGPCPSYFLVNLIYSHHRVNRSVKTRICIPLKILKIFSWWNEMQNHWSMFGIMSHSLCPYRHFTRFVILLTGDCCDRNDSQQKGTLKRDTLIILHMK